MTAFGRLLPVVRDSKRPGQGRTYDLGARPPFDAQATMQCITHYLERARFCAGRHAWRSRRPFQNRTYRVVVVPGEDWCRRRISGATANNPEIPCRRTLPQWSETSTLEAFAMRDAQSGGYQPRLVVAQHQIVEQIEIGPRSRNQLCACNGGVDGASTARIA